MILTYSSITQWGLFIGIAAILFGWIEKRNSISYVGQIIFIALGIFALWIILTNQIEIPEVVESAIPKEIKAVSFFLSLILGGFIGIISVILTYFKIRFEKVVKAILVLFGILLFFIVNHLQQIK